MRTALVFGVTFAAGALFFACAKGDEGVAADGGGVEITEDGSAGDAAKDGNTSYVTDGGTSGDGASDDAETDAAPVCVESDAGCSTGSPGACADGILHCDGGVAVCEALATTESCYSGSVATRNKGICHDGTQTCTGTLGACTDEVDPMPHENCFNNVDDDCNGLINDGCPVSVTIGAQNPLAAGGSGTGGGSHQVVCPAGAFVTRVDSWGDTSDLEASGVSIYCATPSLIQGASSYSVTLAANTPAPYLTEHGTTSPASLRSDDCGISGLTGIVRSDGLSNSHIQGLGFHCGTSAVTLASDNSITFDFVNTGDESYTYYTNNNTGTAFDRLCPFYQVVVGFTVRDGNYLDNITPICAPLYAQYSAGTPD